MNTGALIQKFLEVVITVSVPVLLPMLLAWMYQQYKLVKAQVTDKQQKMILDLIGDFVLAAQQKGLSGDLASVGSEKKQYVLDMIEVELAAHGIIIDLDKLDALIESQVYQQITLFKEQANQL